MRSRLALIGTAAAVYGALLTLASLGVAQLWGDGGQLVFAVATFPVDVGMGVVLDRAFPRRR